MAISRPSAKLLQPKLQVLEKTGHVPVFLCLIFMKEPLLAV